MGSNEKLLLERRKSGLTQTRLCELAGISVPTLVDIEQGRIQLDDDTADRIRKIIKENTIEKEGDK